MARPGVSYLDVAKAAIQLSEQNTRPSIEGVRRLLGTGSNSTIGQHLKNWREKQGNQMELKQGLPESLLIAVKGLHEAMQAETTIKIDAIKSDSDQTIVELKKQIDEKNKELLRLARQETTLEETITVLQAEKTALQNNLNKLQIAHEKQISDNNRLQQQGNDKKMEIERLLKQLNHAQTNLDHYRESMRQERESERQYFEEKIIVLERQDKLQQERLSEREQKLAVLAQQLKASQEDKEKITQELKCVVLQCHQNEIEKQQQITSHRHLDERYVKLSENHKHLTEKTKVDEGIIHHLRLEMERLKAHCGILEKSLEKAESRLRNFTDKHVFLAQEKSVLETQLKQVLATQMAN